jgi:glycosyltransferase involved in cell wall biosynthesis
VFAVSRVLAVTEYYNEAENIPGLVKNLASQTHIPDLWLIIDDGSSDNSTDVFEENLKKHGIPYLLYGVPPKAKANANLKGRAFSKVDILNNEWVQADRFDFLMLIGADTLFPPTYIELSTAIMKKLPMFGALGGRIRNEPGSPTPMGTGKIVRWDVVKATSGRYWDIDPDSLWNLITINMGFRLLIILDLIIDVTRPTHMYGPKGYYDYGKRMKYVGWNFAGALAYSFILAARNSQPRHFLRGYLHAYVGERDWLCHDAEIKEYYSFKLMIQRLVGKTRSRDVATMMRIGINADREKELDDGFVNSAASMIRNKLYK